jgi:hypothetical protein
MKTSIFSSRHATAAGGKMLALFKEHQEALQAAQEAAVDAEDLAAKKEELNTLFEAEKKKIKRAERLEKAKDRQEKVNLGMAKQTKAAKVNEFDLLNKSYTSKIARFSDYQVARTALWDATGGDAGNWTSKSGRVGSSHHRSHHVTTNGLAYKISAKTRTSPAILWAAEDNDEEGPADALQCDLPLNELQMSETAAKLAASEAMQTLLAKYLSKTPEEVIEAGEEQRAEFFKILTRGKEPTLAELKDALAEAGAAGVEVSTRPSRKGTARLLLDLMMLEQDEAEEDAEEADGEE